MTAKDAIKAVMNSNLKMLKMLISDLSDADLLERPVPGANHIAWQLGHLINSQVGLLMEAGGTAMKELLPPGFAEKHAKGGASNNTATDFLAKTQYLDLFDRVQAASLQLLDELPEGKLDQPSAGRMKELAPTIGHLFLLSGNHVMLHAGQFSVVRRRLGKPVAF